MSELRGKVRAVTLADRLDKCADIIGRLCKDGGRIKMTIPPQPDDEDILIAKTIIEAKEQLTALREENEKIKAILNSVVDPWANENIKAVEKAGQERITLSIEIEKYKALASLGQ